MIRENITYENCRVKKDTWYLYSNIFSSFHRTYGIRNTFRDITSEILYIYYINATYNYFKKIQVSTNAEDNVQYLIT